MRSAWILQANPDRYDVESAMQTLPVIHWRVPQHTSEIHPGDRLVIWRSGAEAGIVARGIVQSPPAQMSGAAYEGEFSVDNEDETTTRTRITLQAVPFVPKDSVAALEEMREHQIITAPMGTVFPLTPAQWDALETLLPDEHPPSNRAELGEQSSADATGLPAPFAWDDRYKSVTPLPGRGEHYLDTLNTILERVRATQPEKDELVRWLIEHYDVGNRRSSYSVNFLQRLSLIRASAARVTLTDHGERWLAHQDQLYLLALVHSRIRFIGEMLRFISQAPRSPEEILRYANSHYGTNWTTRAQVDRRRHLLGGLGAVAAEEDGSLALTELGLKALDVLEVQEPRTDTVDDPRDREPQPVQGAPRHAPSTDSDVEQLIDVLERTSHESSNADAFEVAARDAFAYLGFDAEWLGGAGKTDVLLIAELGPEERYRVIVDTKSTAREAVADQQIDWVTLEEHRALYDADHVALVAPAFRGTRLSERAHDRHVALLDVPAIATLLRQHAQAPLGLQAYREVFDPQQGVESVVEAADETRRWLVLAAEVLRLLEELQPEEGALDAGDLYWNLKGQIDDQFEPPSREEIGEILEVLVRPPLQLVRQAGPGYLALGSRETVLRRLALLGELLSEPAARSGHQSDSG
jgi:hypothetical protein